MNYVYNSEGNLMYREHPSIAVKTDWRRLHEANYSCPETTQAEWETRRFGSKDVLILMFCKYVSHIKRCYQVTG